MGIPRIQGAVGQVSEPPEFAGKWFFEMWLSFLGRDEEKRSLGQFGPWDSEKEAEEELRAAAKIACDLIERDISGNTSGEYIDMKTNLRRRWDRKDET